MFSGLMAYFRRTPEERTERAIESAHESIRGLEVIENRLMKVLKTLKEKK